MNVYKRYEGEFCSIAGVLWRVEILQQADASFAQVGELRFPAEDALVIEWEATSKELSLCGSIATLAIESPGDRTYQDLYSIEAGQIHLHVYRQGVIYWSGTLDPEFYEEPYSRGAIYDVTLTFSDFGLLHRRKYTLTGAQSLRSLLNECLKQSGIRYTAVNDSNITTLLPSAPSVHLLDALAVKSENWYDEEGEVNSYYDVLEAILTPLNIRIQQRAGIIYLYDLNGLYNMHIAKEIYWERDNQKMGTDKVANNVKVTFSPYAQSQLSAEKMEYKGEWGEEIKNETSDVPAEGPECYTYREHTAGGYKDSFTIFLDDEITGVQQYGVGCKAFKVVPLFDGEEENGIAVGFSAGISYQESGVKWKLNRPHDGMLATPVGMILKTNRIPIQYLAAEDRGKFMLRLSVDMLIDCRYNPFTDAGETEYFNWGGNYRLWQALTGMVYLLADIRLVDENGNTLAKYDNSEYVKSANLTDFAPAYGKWVEPSAHAETYLSWYSMKDRAESSGLTGWSGNNHSLALRTYNFPSFLEKIDSGQYMTYPDRAGYIEITLYNSIRSYDFTAKLAGETAWDDLNNKFHENELLDKINWFLVKLPVLSVVRNSTTFADAKSEDIEYSGLLNEHAKEDIEIETICGTSSTLLPAARGCYITTATGEQVKQLTRAGRTDVAEELLIGSLYSQFAERKTKLTGTARLEAGGIAPYTELHQDGKKFMLLGETQYTQLDESEIVAVELRLDEYESIK